jgi:hypothetical protein
VIRNAGGAHNAAGPNLSRSTNRSAAGKSEKDNKHQQPEQDVAHNHCPSPCGHCEQIHPDKQAKIVPARRREPPQGGVAAVTSVQWPVKEEGKEQEIHKENPPFIPLLQRGKEGDLSLVPTCSSTGHYLSRMAMASISIIASGLTSAFTTTPVAAGKPFLKYFLRTAAVSL